MKRQTIYAACLSRLGLSLTDAAALHDVGLQSVKNWSVGRSDPQAGIWDDLRRHEATIVDRSEAIRETWEEGSQAAGDGRTCLLDASPDAPDPGLMATVDFLLGTPGVYPAGRRESMWFKAGIS